ACVASCVEDLDIRGTGALRKCFRLLFSAHSDCLPYHRCPSFVQPSSSKARCRSRRCPNLVCSAPSEVSQHRVSVSDASRWRRLQEGSAVTFRPNGLRNHPCRFRGAFRRIDGWRWPALCKTSDG